MLASSDASIASEDRWPLDSDRNICNHLVKPIFYDNSGGYLVNTSMSQDIYILCRFRWISSDREGKIWPSSWTFFPGVYLDTACYIYSYRWIVPRGFGWIILIQVRWCRSVLEEGKRTSDMASFFTIPDFSREAIAERWDHVSKRNSEFCLSPCIYRHHVILFISVNSRSVPIWQWFLTDCLSDDADGALLQLTTPVGMED
jgi:hypothetical protein